MRLICPNCSAQYEVPEDVIPDEGRDVQCSNCGDMWFQPSARTLAGEAEPAAFLDEDPSSPAIAREPEPEFDDAPITDLDSPPEPEDQSAETPVPAPKRQEIDPEVSRVLREEAERESTLRQAEQGAIETQSELGLADPDDTEDNLHQQHSQERVARMRGEEPPVEPAVADSPRRDLLPDIEEINSSLDGKSKSRVSAKRISADGTAEAIEAPKRKGFTRGFALVILLTVAAILIYKNAPAIAEAVPEADPMISQYVAAVDNARVWLDTQAQNLANSAAP